MRRKACLPLLLVLLLLALFTGCSAPLTGNAEASGNDTTAAGPTLVPSGITIPAGTTVAIRLVQGISSAGATAGEQFDASLDDPIVVDGQTLVPRGAPVVGRVVAARHSGRLHNSGYLRITLASITIQGKPVPVDSSSIFVMGGSHKNRDIALIGGGTGAGALIGALAGGGKGALIGSLVGAGAGTGTAYATGKKDVGFGPERRLAFRLTAPIVVR